MSGGPLLVTGAAGFIGARTAALLLDQGRRVVGVDDLNPSYSPALKEMRLEPLRRRPGFEFHALDIADREAVERLFSRFRFEAVLNLAARAGVRQSLEDPFAHLRANTLGTLGLLDQMVRRQVGKLVLASTSSLYARQPLPFSEEAPSNQPLTPYAASKKGAEAMAHAYHEMHGLEVAVLRYFTVFGPAGRPDMSLFRFIRGVEEGRVLEIYGDGLQGRDLTYVDDAARGTVAALRPLGGFRLINLGGGRPPRTLLSLISLIEEQVGRRARLRHLPPHPLDLREARADIRLAGRLLDWRPRVGVEEGIARAVAWHRENRDRLREASL